MRAIRTGAAAAVVTAAVLLSAPAAATAATAQVAGTVDVAYSCGAPGVPSTDQVIGVTLSAPTLARKGSTIQIGVRLDTRSPSPSEQPANGTSVAVSLSYSGAASGSVASTPLTNPDPVHIGETVTFTGGVAQVGATAYGAYLFRPGDVAITTGDHTVTCLVQSNPPVADVTLVY
ncbi:hypothetical protein [Solwaraspora sp. WMMD792]|uniref:hypothetical protein n=1 Tax=Solwaraspora sp. WMMD792 TaxID=3016099 RepID=UPI00241654E7|nr:hypothetical protein [Solwaraspora sp. WMMD792]MDG4770718.1 hypothetical protein [Solwaraspora sp. WMMD792]